MLHTGDYLAVTRTADGGLAGGRARRPGVGDYAVPVRAADDARVLVRTDPPYRVVGGCHWGTDLVLWTHTADGVEAAQWWVAEDIRLLEVIDDLRINQSSQPGAVLEHVVSISQMPRGLYWHIQGSWRDWQDNVHGICVVSPSSAGVSSAFPFSVGSGFVLPMTDGMHQGYEYTDGAFAGRDPELGPPQNLQVEVGATSFTIDLHAVYGYGEEEQVLTRDELNAYAQNAGMVVCDAARLTEHRHPPPYPAPGRTMSIADLQDMGFDAAPGEPLDLYVSLIADGNGKGSTGEPQDPDSCGYAALVLYGFDRAYVAT